MSGRARRLGTLSETYRTCGREGCHCQGDGPKHGPHLNVSYRGENGKTSGYYVPKGAEEATTSEALSKLEGLANHGRYKKSILEDARRQLETAT